jgi:four helix bundle protein
MHRYKDLKVWQKAMELAKLVYETTSNFPKEEKFGLVAQLNRSGVSIPSNIAEGAGRNSNPDFIRFLGIAMGSLYETETQLLLATSFGFIKEEEMSIFSERILEIANMLHKLIQSLNQ